MPIKVAVSEGFVPFRGYRTWYRVVGERAGPQKLPVLLVHGGSYIPSDCQVGHMGGRWDHTAKLTSDSARRPPWTARSSAAIGDGNQSTRRATMSYAEVNDIRMYYAF